MTIKIADYGIAIDVKPAEVSSLSRSSLFFFIFILYILRLTLFDSCLLFRCGFPSRPLISRD